MEKQKAIRTKTQEEFNKVLEVFEKKGWRWISVNNCTPDNIWNIYKQNSFLEYCNYFNYGCIDNEKSKYNYISFEDFLKEEGINIHPKELKIGDRVRINNTPDLWCENAGGSYPRGLQYPKEGIVKNILFVDRDKNNIFTAICITIDGKDYGFSQKELLPVCEIINQKQDSMETNLKEKEKQLEKELQEVREKIKKETEFKNGDWLYLFYNNIEYLFRFNRKEDSHSGWNYVYFSEYYSVNKSSDNVCIKTDDYFANHELEELMVKATKGQIKRILTIVAKHKGFVEGVKFKSPNETWNGIVNNKIEYVSDEDLLYTNSIAIYNKGKWAKILEKEEIIEIDGYKSEVNKQDKTVKFGCKTIKLSQLKVILEVMELNKQYVDSDFIIGEDSIGEENDSDRLLTKDQIKLLIKQIEE